MKSNNKTWAINSPKSFTLSWEPTYQDPISNSWRVESALRKDQGWERYNYRLKQSIPGRNDSLPDGAVCICVRPADGAILFVKQNRPAPGVQLIELPRGKAEPDEQDMRQVAQRELSEETGFRFLNSIYLGNIYPDSGIQAASVAVVLAELNEKELVSEIQTNPETINQVWLQSDEVKKQIINGNIRDGITLSALYFYDIFCSEKEPDGAVL